MVSNDSGMIARDTAPEGVPNWAPTPGPHGTMTDHLISSTGSNAGPVKINDHRQDCFPLREMTSHLIMLILHDQTSFKQWRTEPMNNG